MNTKNIPPLVTLTAGLLAVVLMYIRHYELHTLLWILLLVLLGFYIASLAFKGMLDRFVRQVEEEEKRREEEEALAEAGAVLTEDTDGAVIEKQ